MRFKRNFKMGVISIVLLITGSMLIACGKKEVTTTEQTTAITTEVTTEQTIDDAGISIDGYSFPITEDFDFKSQEDGMYIYMNGDTTFSVLTSGISDDYNSITGETLYAQMKKIWTPDGSTELDYGFAEKDGIKKCFYSIGMKANNETFIQYVTCYIVGKDNKAITIVVFDKATSEDDVSNVADMTEKFNNDFEEQNFWPAE